jgi:hypothetical protein
MLVEMGFTSEQAQKALQLSNNSFDAALELLLRKPDLQNQTEQEQTKFSVEEKQTTFEISEAEFCQQMKQILNIIEGSFFEVMNYFKLVPLSLQQNPILNLFRLEKGERKNLA